MGPLLLKARLIFSRPTTPQTASSPLKGRSSCADPTVETSPSLGDSTRSHSEGVQPLFMHSVTQSFQSHRSRRCPRSWRNESAGNLDRLKITHLRSMQALVDCDVSAGTLMADSRARLAKSGRERIVNQLRVLSLTTLLLLLASRLPGQTPPQGRGLERPGCGVQ